MTSNYLPIILALFINKRLSQQIRVSASIDFNWEGAIRIYCTVWKQKVNQTDHLKSDFKGGGGGGGGRKQNKTARENAPPQKKPS